MPTYEAIGDVSRTLETFLTNQLAGLASAELHDLVAPLPTGSPPTLTLFLYDIVEDASARNRSPARTPVQVAGHQRVTVTKPPVALILRYMMTAWAGDPVSEHRMIGRVIQSLNDFATLAGPQLLGTLASTHQTLNFSLAPIALEDRAQVWEAIRQPYKLSVNYEVRVVRIDSEVSTDVPGVVEQIVQPAIPGGAA